MDHSNSFNLSAAVGQLAGFSKALSYLTTTGVERLTVVQALFFVIAAKAEAKGCYVTLGDIIEEHGDELNRSIVNTYKVLLERSRQYPDGLGWLVRQPDPNDERRNFLRLTPKGRKVAEILLQSLHA